MRMVLVVLTFVLPLTACSTVEIPGISNVGTLEEAKDVVRSATSKTGQGDGPGACALMTDKYKRVTAEKVDDATSCGQAIVIGHQTAKGLGIDLEQLSTQARITKASVAGTRSRITTSIPDWSTQTFTLVWRDGRWLIDDVRSDGESAESPTKADTGRWLENWCDVQPGMTLDEAKGLMGPPTWESLGPDESTPGVMWSRGVYTFSAFVTVDGDIRGLVTGNQDSWGRSDLAKVTCAEARQ